MKKTALLLTLVMGVTMSNVAFAGFGLPKIKDVVKLPGSSSHEEVQDVQVDMEGLTHKQAKVLKYINAATNSATYGMAVINTAVSNPNAMNEYAAAGTLKADNKVDGAKKLIGSASESVPTAAAFDSKLNGTEAERTQLKSAMEVANLNRLASYVNFGKAVYEAKGMIEEATGAVKNLHDIDQIGKLKGIIKTGEQATKLFDKTKKMYSQYDKSASKAKEVLKPEEVKIDSDAAIQAAAAAEDSLE